MVNKRGSELGLKDLDFVSSIFHYSEPHSSSAWEAKFQRSDIVYRCLDARMKQTKFSLHLTLREETG